VTGVATPARTKPANSRLVGNRNRGQQGKQAENLMADALKAFEDFFQDGQFNFERNPDARAAGGVFKAVTGDFHAWWRGKAFFIEVKQVDHAFRLPAKNFEPPSRARLKRKALAGCRVGVFIFHTPTKQWRLCPIDMFFGYEDPSFDLSGIESSVKLIPLLKTFFQG
jgi:hypothetical protein